MELNINGVLAELGDSEPAITKKSIDINDPSTRFIDFTNTFILPDTAKNREIFESPHAIGSNNRSHDMAYAATLNDIFQIFKGHGFLDSSTRDTLKFQIVDESKAIFKALEKKLRDISWDDKDTILTQVAIDALDAIDITTCWIWGKLCLHENALQINTDQTAGDARTKYSRPSFYLQGLLNRAISQQGYALTSPQPDLAFSGFHENFYFTSYQKTIAATYNPAGTLALNTLNTNDFAHADLTVTTTTIDIGTAKTKFRIRGTIISDAAISIVITATDNVDATKISKSNLEIGIGEQVVDFTTSEFQSANGMKVSFDFVGTGEVQVNALFYSLLSDRDFDLSTNPFLGYKIKAYDNLPDLSYLDLFKIICVVSNKFQIIKHYEKTFEFGSLANLSKLNAVDWSDKFIIGSENVSSNYPGLFQKNWLKYANDLTVNPRFGWSYFNSDNESFEKEGEYFMLNFGASNDVTINSNLIAQMKVYTDTERQVTQPIAMRLFQVNGSLLQFTPLNWETLKSNYEGLFNSLFRIRAIDCEVNISKLDFLSWTEKQLVYIDYFKTTFLVLEIANFIPGKPTKIKLLAYGR